MVLKGKGSPTVRVIPFINNRQQFHIKTHYFIRHIVWGYRVQMDALFGREHGDLIFQFFFLFLYPKFADLFCLLQFS